jgi:hypothetical protein
MVKKDAAMNASQSQAEGHDRIEMLINRIYTVPSGRLRTALVAVLAAEESLVAAQEAPAGPRRKTR